MSSESLIDPTVDALEDVAVTDPADIPADEGDHGDAELVEEVAGGGAAAREDLAVEGLTPVQRASAQNVIAKGARLLLDHAAAVHYTQGPQRWQGIAQRLYVRDGRFPAYGDCSSTATWLLWNGLFVHLGMGDVVNGANWTAGYTGTMLQHGRAIPESSAQVGDLVIYGSAPPGQHVVVCLGGGVAFSHGSEPGPFKVNIRFRSDILSVRRYF